MKNDASSGMDVRDWLMEVDQTTSFNFSTGDAFKNVQPTRKLKHLELSFGNVLEDAGDRVRLVEQDDRVEDDSKVEVDVKKKKKSLKELTKENRKMTGWLQGGWKKTAREKDLDDVVELM